MPRRDEPTPREDATSLSAIGLGAGISLAATALVAAALVLRVPPAPAPLVPSSAPPAEALIDGPSVPSEAGADRLAGRVVTEDGRVLEGWLRWNDREASWGDLLPATRPGSRALDGVRFGHLARLERIGATGMRATSRSGRVAELQAGGTVARAAAVAVAPVVTVETPEGVHRVPWRDLREVRFASDAAPSAPRAERLHGTVATASGDVFTGYVLWNGSEGFLTDRVGDEVEDQDRHAPFDQVTAVRRTGPGTLDIETREGGVITLATRALIRPGPDEILVADPGLGVVAVPWSSFRTLHVHPAERPVRWEDFDGGRALHGAVTTEAGEVLSGPVAWDLDEATTAALLDGMDREVRYGVELGRVASVEKHRQGVRVTLRDGRGLYLAGTNDVNWANRGIRVGDRTVAWSEFRILHLEQSEAMP